MFIYIVLGVVGAVGITAGSFFAGRKYGEEIEAKIVARELRLFAGWRNEYAAVIADMKLREIAAIARIKKYL